MTPKAAELCHSVEVAVAAASLGLHQTHLQPRVLLLVALQLPLPLLHVGGGLLQGRGQPHVVVLQRLELDLPLLGVGRALGQRQLEAVILILELSLACQRGIGGLGLVLGLLRAVGAADGELVLQQVRVDRVILIGEVVRDVVIVFVAVTRSGDGGGVGRGGGGASASVAFSRLSPDPRRGLLDLGELLYELVQFRLRAEAEAVHCVGPDIGPLPELLTRLGECHVGGDGGVDDSLGPLHGDDPVEGAGGVIEEGDGNCGA